MISDATYDDFLKTYQMFMSAQLCERETPQVPAVLSERIHLDQITAELPEDAKRINSKYHDAVDRLQIFPIGVCHGDLNPFNLLRDGVIDFENAFSGPIVYDTLGLIATDKFFPESSEYEFSKMYAFSKEQERIYIWKLQSGFSESIAFHHLFRIFQM